MLIRSISGIRGIIDTHLTEKVVREHVAGANQIFGDGAIVVGRDSRPSGAIFTNILIDQLVKLGRNIIFCDIVPTPTVQFMVEQTDAGGGIIITASHNPEEWNGIKFVRSDGTFFLPDENQQMFDLVDKGIKETISENRGIVMEDKNAIQKHIIKNVSLSFINTKNIRERSYKVVIDAINGAGSTAVPAMLEALGCDVIPINCEPTGDFVHGTEPLPHNLAVLCETVVKEKADIGFAVDPDADRLAVVNEKGEPIGEEYTLVLATEGYINSRQSKETFVTNLSTTMALDKLAEKHCCKVERSAVGEINVVQKMIELESKLGGEGNGGVILKEAHLGRDSLVGVTMLLNRLSQSDEPLSKIMEYVPHFEIIKDKIELKNQNVYASDPQAIFNKAKDLFQDAEVNNIDGLKFIWNDKWLHLRASNTEPIMRIYAEGKNSALAKELVKKFKSVI